MELTAELNDALSREQIEQARGMSPGQKMMLGAFLFQRHCASMRAGVRDKHPRAGAAAFDRALQERRTIAERLGEPRLRPGAPLPPAAGAFPVVPDELRQSVLAAAATLPMPWMLLGATAVCYYAAFPDSDGDGILVDGASEGVEALAARLGPAFRVTPHPQLPAAARRDCYTVAAAGTAPALLLFGASDDPHEHEALSRRRSVRLADAVVFLPAAEDVVIEDLRWALVARRTAVDARNLVAIQGDSLDWPYIHRWCDQHGTRALLDEIRQSIPPL